MINKIKLALRMRKHRQMAVANKPVKLPVRSESGFLLFVDPALPPSTLDRLRAAGGA